MVILSSKFSKMKTINGFEVPLSIQEIAGLSTETKPAMKDGTEEGSTFLEEDTSSVFIMKADGAWKEL